MKPLQDYIQETLQMYICEGFDINEKDNIVSFNPNHQDNVDTNDYINPYIIMNDTKTGEMILSLFERKDNESSRGDGNPIVYALKNIKGWRFNNPKVDIMALMKRFVAVTKALNSHFDTLIISPSNNNINKQVFSYLKRLIDYNDFIEEFFEKLPMDEIEAECDNKVITEYAQNHKISPEYLHKMVTKWFNAMNGAFSYKEIPARYRDVITTAIKLSPSVIENIESYAPMINGKDVLVFDDTVASGKTLSDCAEALRTTFDPHSITFLTLFSPKSSKDFSNVRVNLNNR